MKQQKDEAAHSENNKASKKIKNCSIRYTRDGDNIELIIEGEITIYNVKELLHFIQNEVGEYKKLNLDLSLVTRFDTAGYQLMMYIKKITENRDKIFHCKKPSSEVSKTFVLLGEHIICQGI